MNIYWWLEEKCLSCRIRQSAQGTRRRVFIVETMGGWLCPSCHRWTLFVVVWIQIFWYSRRWRIIVEGTAVTWPQWQAWLVELTLATSSRKSLESPIWRGTSTQWSRKWTRKWFTGSGGGKFLFPVKNQCLLWCILTSQRAAVDQRKGKRKLQYGLYQQVILWSKISKLSPQ